MDNCITVGDVVCIYFENIKSIFNARILAMPEHEGGYWTVRDGEGRIWNVQHFACMKKMGVLKAGE